MVMRGAWLAVVVIACAACGDEGETGRIEDAPPASASSPAPGEQPGAPDAPKAGETPSKGDDPAALPPVKLKIKIDYRFDTKGFFSSPDRRAAVEGAARIWGRLVQDDFPMVPKGTHVKVRDPEHPAEPAQSLDIDDDIDDLVIFVGSSALVGSTTASSQATAGLAGITDEALAASLEKRFYGTPFQPWTGWISFDEGEPWYFDADPDVPKTIPAGKLDFVSVALHEMCHVLGFGTADAFKALANTGSFDGAKARAAAGGNAPALTSDHTHFASTVLVSGKRPLMDVSDSAGTRYLPTAVDTAVLEDLGYHF
jgi:hypothetical protein